MRILTWNVNGIRAVVRKDAFDWLFQSDLDVIGLQETKAHVEQLSPEILEREGYRSVWAQAERKGYSGTVLYYREDSGFENAPFEFTDSRFNTEGRVTRIRRDDVFLYNIYFPNGGRSEERLQYKMDFYAAFEAVLDDHMSAGEHVIFMGDVNTAHKEIDVAEPETWSTVSGFLPKERAWVDGIIGKGYLDSFRDIHPDVPDQFTWWNMRTRARAVNRGWRIDYIFLCEATAEYLADAWISPDIEGSDHCPVGVELELD